MKMAEELQFRGGIDEFIVDGDNIDVIHSFKEKTERLFQVQINFDSVAKLEDKSKQWISVQGEKIDRKNAKEYIIGLCQPGTVQEFCIKGYGDDQLTEEAIEEIEKHTNAAICPINRDMVQIRGTDLAVILAVSSLESIVGQQGMDTETDGAIQTPKEGRDDREEEGNVCLSRLDTTLRRALSSQSDVTCSIEDYNKTSPSIKMTLLKCVSDFRDIDDSELFPSTGSSCGPTSYKLPVYMDDDDNDVDNIDGGPANPNAFNHVNNSDKEKVSPVQNITKKLGHVSVSPSSSPKPQKIVAPDTPEHQYLRRFGLSVGYSTEEVEEGLLYVDQKTKPADFLEMLNKIKQKNSFDCDEKHSNIATRGSIHNLENEDLGTDRSNDQDDNSKSSFPPPPEIPTGDNSGIIGRRSLPQDYKKRLIKDFTEENSDLSVTELKRRNEERQKMLKVAFDKNQSEKQKIEENQNTGKSSKKKKRRKKNKNKKQEKDSGKNDENLTGKSSQNEKSNVTIHLISSDDDMEDEEETRVLKLWQINENKPSSGSDDDCKIVDVVGTKPVLHQPKVQPNTTNQHWPQPTGQYQPRQQGPWFPTQPPVMPYMGYPPPPLPQYMSPHAYPPRPYMNSPMAQLPQGPIKNPKGPLTSKQLRYVVIDGSNVAMCHGNGKVFSCKGIQIVVDYFLKRGHKQVTAFVPEWRKYNPRPENPINNQDVLEKLKSEGHLVFTPSRRLNGRLIVSYDDRFVLELAEREDGIIVSNDQYRDLMGEKVSWRKIIEERLLLFSFAGDNFMPPFDPLGRDGPTLDDFLCKPTGRKRSASPISSHLNAWQQRDCPPAVKQRGYPNSRGLPNNLNFPGTPRFQHNYQGQKQQNAGNQDGFAHRGRGRGGHMNNPNSPRRHQNLTSRSDEKTKELEEQLKAIFPDEQEKILEILNNHKCETDLPKLTNYLMNAIFQS